MSDTKRICSISLDQKPGDNRNSNSAPTPSNGSVEQTLIPSPTSPSPGEKVRSTGSINVGPGAGARNVGKRTGSFNNNKGVIFFSKSDEEKVPPDGNLNKGPGAGGTNKGNRSGSINNNTGNIWF